MRGVSSYKWGLDPPFWVVQNPGQIPLDRWIWATNHHLPPLTFLKDLDSYYAQLVTRLSKGRMHS